VTHAQIDRWLREDEAPGFDIDAIARETEERVQLWNRLGRQLCDGFVAVAERVGAPV
jgi:hypothetical protein